MSGSDRSSRQLAVLLFTDLVDSTALRQRLGERAADELRTLIDELQTDLVTTNGGRVVKHTGDGIMAAFGSVTAALGCSAGLHIEIARLGTGMALPYLVLSAKPEWIDRMPRTGPASDLIKQVMGLLLLAAAAYFIGAGLAGLMVTPPEPPSHTYWWVVSAFGTAAGGWLAWRTFRLTRRAGNRVFFGGIGAFILVVSALIGLSQTAKGPIDWTYYTPERLAEAQGSGKVVVIDFTAEWCANCKTLEALVLNLPSVSGELNADDVAAIKVDLTGNNEAGNALLKASNRVTIPLLLIYGRDGSIVLNTENYTIQQVLDAITEARARGGA